jgi:sugar fermentation stimulation protein A
VRFPPLIEGRLIRRYQRFLADVRLPHGEIVTAFVPNTGSLMSCVVPERPVWLREMPAKARRYRFDWVLVRPQRSLVCVDTGVPNRVVHDFARAQKIPLLAGYREYLREVPYGERSRADLCCRVHRDDMLRRCWVEVKSTTLRRGRAALFPDAVTLRGRKHLIELRGAVTAGDEALQLFFVQRGDCECFRPADDIDPEYGAELRRAAAAGVKVIALEARISKRAVTIKRQLPVEL